MKTFRSTMARLYLVLLNLAFAAQVFAAEEVTQHQHTWPWWHGGHGYPFWWIFPLMFFLFMVVMCFLMMRRGGMGCMWRNWMDGPEYRDSMNRHRGERTETALEILDRRYASGEIDKHEYEEKKSVLTRSG